MFITARPNPSQSNPTQPAQPMVQGGVVSWSFMGQGVPRETGVYHVGTSTLGCSIVLAYIYLVLGGVSKRVAYFGRVALCVSLSMVSRFVAPLRGPFL